MSDKIERKLSAKMIMGERPRLLEGQKERRLFVIFGVANGIKTSPDRNGYGPSIGLVGNFEATNIETGEVFVSGRAYLPEPVHSMITAQVMGKPDSAVEFGYEIGIKGNDTPIGYEYTVKPMIKPSESDPLKALRDQVKSNLALPAPTPTDKPKATNAKSSK